MSVFTSNLSAFWNHSHSLAVLGFIPFEICFALSTVWTCLKTIVSLALILSPHSFQWEQTQSAAKKLCLPERETWLHIPGRIHNECISTIHPVMVQMGTTLQWLSALYTFKLNNLFLELYLNLKQEQAHSSAAACILFKCSTVFHLNKC